MKKRYIKPVTIQVGAMGSGCLLMLSGDATPPAPTSTPSSVRTMSVFDSHDGGEL